MRFNPFNYTKPLDGKSFRVDGKNLRGRSEESGLVDYYLSEARGGNLTNMAVLGSPQIGKTSLLNYAKYRAEQAGMVCIQISPWEHSDEENIDAERMALFEHMQDDG